jgi:GT2 family glycosyltransferase
VDWVSGAALVARRTLLDDIGLLDERFFMYCEDVDLGYRAKEHGWRVSYFPGAEVVHARAKSSDQTPNRMIIEHHKSMYQFFLKHYSKDASIIKRMIVPLGLVARASGFVGRNYFYRLKWALGRNKRNTNV